MFRWLVFICAFLFVILSYGGKEAMAKPRKLSVAVLYKMCQTYRKFDGNNARANKSQIADMATCHAYIGGFVAGKVATNLINDTKGPFCLPKHFLANSDKLVGIFMEWNRRNRRLRNITAFQGLAMSFMAVARCYDPPREECETN